MDLEELRSFVSVAHRMNCTHAARELDISQSTVTRHIQNLEEELGSRLIERRTRLMTLTKAGNRFLLWAEGALERYQRMLDDLKQDGTDDTGTVTIASTVGPYEFIVLRLIVSFLSVRPHASLETTVCPSSEVFAKLLAGRANIGFTGTRPDSRFNYDVIATDEVVLAVPADHPLARLDEVPLEDLSKVSFLMREPGSGTRLTFETALAKKRRACPPFKVSQVLNSTEAVVTAVQEGYGVGLVSLLAIQARAPEGIKVVRIKDLRMPRAFYMVSCANSTNEGVTAAFEEWAHENRASSAASFSGLEQHARQKSTRRIAHV